MVFINQGVLEGTKSISQKFNQVAKMNFPLSIIPTYIVTSRFYGHLGLLAIIIIACMFKGIIPSIHIVQLLIYVPFAFLLTSSVALLTSTLGILVRDTQMIMQALMRILFYMSQFYGYLKSWCEWCYTSNYDVQPSLFYCRIISCGNFIPSMVLYRSLEIDVI